jgi:hypothetical protein
MLSHVLPLLGAGHPFWMYCGGWLFVLFHSPPVGEARRRTVCEILTLIGTKQSYPLYPPSCSCDWPYYLQSTSIKWQNCPYYLNFHPNQFSHPKDGGSTIFRNFDTFNHSTVGKPIRRLSSDYQPLCSSENLQKPTGTFALLFCHRTQEISQPASYWWCSCISSWLLLQFRLSDWSQLQGDGLCR